MKLRDRIGIDLSRSIRIEDGVEWAARNGVRFLDIQLDTAANAITSFDAKRVAAVRSVRPVTTPLPTTPSAPTATLWPCVASPTSPRTKSDTHSASGTTGRQPHSDGAR